MCCGPHNLTSLKIYLVPLRSVNGAGAPLTLRSGASGGESGSRAIVAVSDCAASTRRGEGAWIADFEAELQLRLAEQLSLTSEAPHMFIYMYLSNNYLFTYLCMIASSNTLYMKSLSGRHCFFT